MVLGFCWENLSPFIKKYVNIKCHIQHKNYSTGGWIRGGSCGRKWCWCGQVKNGRVAYLHENQCMFWGTQLCSCQSINQSINQSCGKKRVVLHISMWKVRILQYLILSLMTVDGLSAAVARPLSIKWSWPLTALVIEISIVFKHQR